MYLASWSCETGDPLNFFLTPELQDASTEYQPMRVETFLK